ncbi:MAG: hypothetical protein ACR2PL_25500 [Dehalococcoidia bacterium]
MTAPDMSQTDEIARLRARVADLERERDAAHQREAATAEVLQAISHSPTDLQAVLETIVRSKVGRESDLGRMAAQLWSATRVVQLREGFSRYHG